MYDVLGSLTDNYTGELANDHIFLWLVKGLNYVLGTLKICISSFQNYYCNFCKLRFIDKSYVYRAIDFCNAGLFVG